jgi:hypothetical protein
MWLCMLMSIFMVAWMVLGWGISAGVLAPSGCSANGQMSHR